jgi:hypothetical protein
LENRNKPSGNQMPPTWSSYAKENNMNKRLAASLLLAPLSFLSFSSAASQDYFGGLSVSSYAHLLAPYDIAPRFSGGFGDRRGDRVDTSIGLTDIRIGYAWSKRFAIEADFARAGNAGSLTGMHATLLPANSRGMGLDAVGSLPISSALTVMGRAGVRRVTGEVDTSQLLPNGVPMIGALNQAKVGLGLQYQFSRSLGFRAEVERYRNIGSDRQVADSDGDAFRFGLYWRF